MLIAFSAHSKLISICDGSALEVLIKLKLQQIVLINCNSWS